MSASFPDVSDEAEIYAATIEKTARAAHRVAVGRTLRGPADPADVPRVQGLSRITDTLGGEIQDVLGPALVVEFVEGSAGLTVRDDAADISLGVIVGVDDRTVHVNVRTPTSEITLVLQLVFGEWTVTGRTGPTAIA